MLVLVVMRLRLLLDFGIGIVFGVWW